MPVFPIPVFAAVVLAYVWLRAVLLGETPRPILVLIAACAGQTLLIALNQHYHLAALAPLQPVFALVIPALAYLAFLETAVRPVTAADILTNCAAALVGVLSLLLLPDALDGLVIATYVAYGVLILNRTAEGPDSLPLVALEHGERTLRIWRAIAAALLISALSDAAIAGAMLAGEAWLRPWIISFVSSGLLLLIGLLNISEALRRTPEESIVTRGDQSEKASEAEAAARGDARPTTLQDPSQDANTGSQDAQDRQVLSTLEQLLTAQRLYLDPSLSLGKLARRLKVPEKQLSAALNRQTGENVSRYINGYRIDHACRLLVDGDSVTTVIFASGFNTKSNFNREFLRLKGCPPSAWLKTQSA